MTTRSKVSMLVILRNYQEPAVFGRESLTCRLAVLCLYSNLTRAQRGITL